MSKVLRALSVTALLAFGPAAPAAATEINGTNGPDTLVGTPTADLIHGYGGADEIHAEAGADRVHTGRDDKRDTVYAGPGPDQVHSRLGDLVHTGLGNDVVRIGIAQAWGMTQFFCGPGYDRVHETWGGDHSGAGEPDDGNDWLVAWHSCEEVY